MGLLQTLTGIFKQKGIELTSDEVVSLASAIEPTNEPSKEPKQPPKIETINPDEFKHHNQTIVALTQRMEEMSKQNTALNQQVEDLLNKLGEERTAREQGIKVLEEKQAAEHKAKIETIIEDAKKAGRIPAENKELIENYKKILENDIDGGLAIINALPVAPAVPDPNNLNAQKSNGSGTTFTPLSKAESLDAYIAQIPIL